MTVFVAAGQASPASETKRGGISPGRADENRYVRCVVVSVCRGWAGGAKSCVDGVF